MRWDMPIGHIGQARILMHRAKHRGCVIQASRSARLKHQHQVSSTRCCGITQNLRETYLRSDSVYTEPALRDLTNRNRDQKSRDTVYARSIGHNFFRADAQTETTRRSESRDPREAKRVRVIQEEVELGSVSRRFVGVLLALSFGNRLQATPGSIEA